MRFKQYLKEKGISVRELSEKTGIPYSTLSDLVNSKTDIDNMRLGFVKRIAKVFSLSIEAFCKLCEDELPIINDGVIFVKNKKYYVRYNSLNDETKEVVLCKVTEDSGKFIKDIAEWEMEDIREEEMIRAWRNPSI